MSCHLPPFTVALREHVPEKLIDFSDKNMLQFIEFERFPLDRMMPFDLCRCRHGDATLGCCGMKDYIPELSEIRMVQRAPEGPLPFADEDRSYVFSCLADVESSFGLCGFPGVAPEAIASRALIRQLIEWWRTLEPVTETQRDAYGRLPGAIRLIDTVSIWVEEQAARRKAKSSGA